MESEQAFKKKMEQQRESLAAKRASVTPPVAAPVDQAGAAAADLESERGNAPVVVDPLDPHKAIEDAAKVLMGMLPIEAQGLIREAQETLHYPVWQMLLGYVMKAHERSELFSPYILAAWETGIAADAPRPCKSCSNLFTSQFSSAQYCCNPCHFGKVAALGHGPDCTTGLARPQVEVLTETNG